MCDTYDTCSSCDLQGVKFDVNSRCYEFQNLAFLMNFLMIISKSLILLEFFSIIFRNPLDNSAGHLLRKL